MPKIFLWIFFLGPKMYKYQKNLYKFRHLPTNNLFNLFNSMEQKSMQTTINNFKIKQQKQYPILNQQYQFFY